MSVIAECGITFEAKVRLAEVESDQVKRKVQKKKREGAFLTERTPEQESVEEKNKKR